VFELKTFEKALVPRVYHSFKPIHEASAAFIEYLFATKVPDNELAKLITSGARMDGLLNIGYEAFSSIRLTIPQKAEQDTIADFSRILDNLITTQAEKVEQLKQLKAAYLQKMFT
jgi:type I restriction enzyme S subunit